MTESCVSFLTVKQSQEYLVVSRVYPWAAYETKQAALSGYWIVSF